MGPYISNLYLFFFDTSFMKFLFNLIIVCSIFCQTEVKIFTAKTDVLIGVIEKDIIQNVLELYNKSNTNKLLPRFVEYENFNEMMAQFIKYSKENVHTLLCINRITITDERKKNYDFSVKYLPGQLSYIVKKEQLKNKPINRTKTLLYVRGTIHEDVAKKVHQKYGMPITSVPSSFHFYEELRKGTYDYGIVENVSIWNKKEFTILRDVEFQLGSGYGILYPKHSKLKNMLDKYLIYYLKSTRLKNLLKKSFGEEVANYFVKSMLNK